MRPGRGLVRGILAALTLPALAAGSVSGAASAPVKPGWSADPDDQYLLEVNIRQLKLGDGVRAYGTPEGTCVLLGDFLTTLDVPMRIDLAAKKASGWAFSEKNRISIDLGTGQVAYGAKHEMLSGGTVRETHNHRGIHSIPSAPQAMNAERQPHNGMSIATMRGAPALPRAIPTWFSEVPSANSLAGR